MSLYTVQETQDSVQGFAVLKRHCILTTAVAMTTAALAGGPIMTDPAQKTFMHLFVDSQRALRRYVRQLVKSPEATEDIVQEAFLRTYEKAEQVEVPRAFLFSTARNLAFDVARHKRTRKTDLMGDFDALNVVTPEESVESLLMADEQSRMLREAMERLTPQCRAVFALRIFHSCSYKEIARRLGISPKTVESHIARALRESHKFLQHRYQVK